MRVLKEVGGYFFPVKVELRVELGWCSVIAG